MTFRAVILGLLGAILIATAGCLTGFVRIPSLTRGHLPISIFGMLFVLMAAVNPLLGWLRANWRLRSSEIALALAMTLVACNIADAGLLRHFPSMLVMPLQLNRTMAGWRKTEVLSYVSPGLLVKPPGGDTVTVGGFISGLRTPGASIGISDVPWGSWQPALAFWLPIVVLMAGATISLSLIAHRQWSDRERLRYPIADFANTLLQQDPARAMGPIFHNKLFWLGLIVLLLARSYNCADAWFDFGVKIPFEFELKAVSDKFPKMAAMEEAKYVIKPLLIPTAVGFTFFLASDIGLSIGIASLVTLGAHLILLKVGVDVGGGAVGGVKQWVNLGSFVGYAVVLLYIGRRYYWQTFKQTVAFRRQADSDRGAAWAGRLFILSCAGMVWMLTVVGAGWPVAVISVCTMMILFLVLGRINAEAGVFFYKPAWDVWIAVGGLFSLPVLGPKGTIVVVMFSVALTADPFESLIPYVINGLKISDATGIKPSRAAVAQAGAYVLALALAIPAVLWASYNFGTGGSGTPAEWAAVPFNQAERAVTQLNVTGQLQQVNSYSPWQRLMHINPGSRFLWSVGVGVGLVILIGSLRLRWPWWPLHPIVLLGFGAWTMGKFGASFLLGWLIKTLVTRLGGPRAYQQGRNLMMGVIAGDLLGGLVHMVTRYIYFAFTGLQAPGEMQVLW